ncbi:ZIP family metal transporter [Pseudodesulfovibrio cashew]|uniref:ZIP family metal transporter n=1 Tax=Pseudodesulfovibrio cashew TaxID=2678688 RepID=A0A6I6JHV0_9BACT|nr:ZIP family metal transporter [Pseudodesulfovibrio cashew]QGY39922.1 ZIP family metal transporter [Pseudodesulfovibrio cashew]
MNWFMAQSPVLQALMAGLFTWSVTALGAALVFTAKDISKKTLDVMLGFAGGVMIAASYWSLLAPAIEMSSDLGTWSFVPAAVGFVMGAIFLRLVDMFLPHLHLNAPMSEAEGVKTSWQRSTLLVTAITLHNIPEGLAVGVAFGAVAAGLNSATFAGAVALAMGIGIQNFPEGTAVSVPLRREGMSRTKAFLYGQASGLVEPIAAVLGAAAVLVVQPLLPYALAFAAGAMIFVVVEEVIPESQSSGNGDLATMGVIFGFTLMMTLDVALG